MAERSFSGRPWAAPYFAVQGLAVAAWWWLLWSSPGSRARFHPAGSPETDLLAFWLPDLVLGAGGSLVAAVLVRASVAWRVPVVWMVAGSMIYGALYTIALAVATDDAWWSVAFMAPAAFFSTLFALDASVGAVPIFRLSAVTGPGANLAKTLGQIAVFWTFFLYALPSMIVAVEVALGGAPFGFAGQVPMATTLFVAASALGLWSGVTMSRRGGGTPLPFDGTNALVTTGPYAALRNPMVVAGLGQGLAVGVGMGSWLVIAYVAVGGVIWQWLVRPAEERDLAARFGRPYDDYRAAVPCWWPRRPGGSDGRRG